MFEVGPKDLTVQSHLSSWTPESGRNGEPDGKSQFISQGRLERPTCPRGPMYSSTCQKFPFKLNDRGCRKQGSPVIGRPRHRRHRGHRLSQRLSLGSTSEVTTSLLSRRRFQSLRHSSTKNKVIFTKKTEPPFLDMVKQKYTQYLYSLFKEYP